MNYFKTKKFHKFSNDEKDVIINRRANFLCINSWKIRDLVISQDHLEQLPIFLKEIIVHRR